MPHLSICALGPLGITLDGQAITGLAYDKVWALLVYLVYAPDQSHKRESLAGLLWPDQPEEKARTNLRQALARLRKAVGDAEAASPFLLSDHSGIRFDAAGDTAWDVAEFTTLLAACVAHTHRHAESCTACAERRTRAVALYRGVFLEKFYIGDSDLFEEWTTLVREWLHQQALEALAALVAYHERRGNYSQALRYGERQLELEPWREEAYRQVMRILALNGRRSAALRCYERCRAVLEAELGVPPSDETTALYEQICAAELNGTATTDYLALPTQRFHNLPLPPTPFIGREQELAALARLLANPQCRLITLLGPGGIGKTRLALQMASDEDETFADGTIYVSLAPLTDAELIVPTVAAALNFTLGNQAAPITELLHYLRRKELLLVLDNFEHLLAPPTPSPTGDTGSTATKLLSAILQQAPGVTLLVTSLERLNVQGEWGFDVGGLETPPLSYSPLSYGADGEREVEFEGYPAVALFLQTARRIHKDFTPTVADRAAIVRICHLVQGMPLALELAATWVRVLSCREIAHEIAQSLGFLTTPLRDLPERHRSLQAVFDHSWKLLSGEEQRVFACCSVFRGGFTREAAAAVAGASLPVLAALVDKSLLRRNLNGRYEVHELARQYAAERLADSQQAATRAHVETYAAFAEMAAPALSGPDHLGWLARLDADHDNCRAALRWAITHQHAELAMRIGGALWSYWLDRGYHREGRQSLSAILECAGAASRTPGRARVLTGLGAMSLAQGNLPESFTYLEEAEAIFREWGDERGLATALEYLAEGCGLKHGLNMAQVYHRCVEAVALYEKVGDPVSAARTRQAFGYMKYSECDFGEAQAFFEETLAVYKKQGHEAGLGVTLCNLGRVLFHQQRYAEANQQLSEALQKAQARGDRGLLALVLYFLGRVACEQGEYTKAKSLLEESLHIYREIGTNIANIAFSLIFLEAIARVQGDTSSTSAMLTEALTLVYQGRDTYAVSLVLSHCAGFVAGRGKHIQAVQLIAAGHTLHHSLKPKMLPGDQKIFDASLAVVRHLVPAEDFVQAWAAGERLTIAEAVALALAELTGDPLADGTLQLSAAYHQ